MTVPGFPRILKGKTSAQGGTVSDVGNYRIHTFLSTSTLSVSGYGEVDYLVIAGGGSGRDSATAGRHAGGGAGGYLEGSIRLAPGLYRIEVGAGGSGNAVQGASSSIVRIFDSKVIVQCFGGGGGNLDGGSGGGSGYEVYGQGNRGGFIGSTSSAGGGGAGAVGANGQGTTVGGNGGAGLASSIDGVSTFRGGGGGGCTGGGGGTPGTGGIGGGGNGGTTDGTPSTTPGQPNTGGGGGGGQPGDPVLFINNQGGSGIVIVRYVR